MSDNISIASVALLGLHFVESNIMDENISVWHEDVSYYRVYDQSTMQELGAFYLDLHPREGKYTHAACFNLVHACDWQSSMNKAKTRRKALTAMVCNFSKPTKKRPSLLLFNEVVTYFHEFGHVMHNICTEASFNTFSGTRVETDFVEAPSQMLENWCYEADVLKRLSKHYQTGDTLPESMRVALVNARRVNMGLIWLRQLALCYFDMAIHTGENTTVDTKALWMHFNNTIALIHPPEGTNASASFVHMIAGYSAGYYGYLWSKVYATDMYESVFKQTGPFNVDVGQRYRREILAPGKSRDAMDSLEAFLGRKPNNKAFLKLYGLV